VTLQRISRKTVLTLVVLAGAAYFLVPQFADLPGIVEQVKDANWAWLPAVLMASAVTYVGATMSLGGAIVQRVPIGPLFVTQVGSAFANKITPAGIGGMALNIRFLEKQGIDRPVAVSGVGMNTLAGFVGHMTLMLVFLLWSGRDTYGGFRLPHPTWFVLGALIAVALAGLAMAVRSTRRMVIDELVPILQRAGQGMGDVLRRPRKVARLFAGTLVVTSSYLASMYLSTRAFGGGLPFATVGAVFLVGAAVASAAPTPGGLGAMEAALIAGLVAAGLDAAVAVPAVFLYRLCTFWFPVLPGWASFLWLQRRELI